MPNMIAKFVAVPASDIATMTVKQLDDAVVAARYPVLYSREAATVDQWHDLRVRHPEHAADYLHFVGDVANDPESRTVDAKMIIVHTKYDPTSGAMLGRSIIDSIRPKDELAIMSGVDSWRVTFVDGAPVLVKVPR